MVNFSIIGPLVLTAIFLKSTPLTEKISLSKYPKYEEYKTKVSSIIPWFSDLNIKNE
jgi:steroid 5-alpha reductase family enzyme